MEDALIDPAAIGQVLVLSDVESAWLSKMKK